MDRSFIAEPDPYFVKKGSENSIQPFFTKSKSKIQRQGMPSQFETSKYKYPL
jgi:hypothetical protein